MIQHPNSHIFPTKDLRFSLFISSLKSLYPMDIKAFKVLMDSPEPGCVSISETIRLCPEFTFIMFANCWVTPNVRTMNATLIQEPSSGFPCLEKDAKLAGRYQIMERLGEGGFADTFLALDTYLPDNYRCVVKQLKSFASDDERQYTAQRLFREEAFALHQLGNHSQVPKLLAHFMQDNESYLIQEYIEGHSLSQELQPGRIWDEGSVLQLLEDLLTVLAYTHHHNGGYIHRDIKPSNIIRRHSDHKLVLIDFGSVKPIVKNESKWDGLMGQTVIVGTFGYMDSQQLRGKPRRSCDLYAVGMLAIYALTGLNPAFGVLPEDRRTGALLWRACAIVSAKLAGIIDRMIHPDLRQRYISAEEALKEVQALLISYQIEVPTVIKTLPLKEDIILQVDPGIADTYLPAFNVREPQVTSRQCFKMSHETLVNTPVTVLQVKEKSLADWIKRKVDRRMQLLLLVMGAWVSLAAFLSISIGCSSGSICSVDVQHAVPQEIQLDSKH
jgi:serine/threonine protein kinase